MVAGATSSILLQLPGTVCCQVTGIWPSNRGRVTLILALAAAAATLWGVKVAMSEAQGQEKELVERGKLLRCSACLRGSKQSRSKQVDLHRHPRWINPQEELLIMVVAGLRGAGWGEGVLLSSRTLVVVSHE